MNIKAMFYSEKSSSKNYQVNLEGLGAVSPTSNDGFEYIHGKTKIRVSGGYTRRLDVNKLLRINVHISNLDGMEVSVLNNSNTNKSNSITLGNGCYCFFYGIKNDKNRHVELSIKHST